MVRKFPAADTPSFRARRSGRRIIPSKLLTKNAALPFAPKKAGGQFQRNLQRRRRLWQEQAEEDDAYAVKEYYRDLERAKLYADTGRKMKS